MFYLEKTIKLIIQLPTLLIILGIITIIFHKINKKKTAKYLLISTMLLFWLFSTEAGARLLVQPLTTGLSSITTNRLPSKANILVLGGGCRNTKGDSEAEKLSNPSLRRTLEGIRIKQLLTDSRLILSGTDWRFGCDIAAIGHRLITDWNDEITQIEELNPARNTREEAAMYKLKYGTKDTLILVTSATHMKRAMRNFRKEGINVIPAPTDFRYYPQDFGISYLLPDAENFNQSTAAWSEWCALMANK